MDSNATEDRLLTVEEIAAYLGLKVGTVYNKVHRREIPFEKVGRAVRFRRSTVDEWVQSHPALTDDDATLTSDAPTPDEPERASA